MQIQEIQRQQRQQRQGAYWLIPPTQTKTTNTKTTKTKTIKTNTTNTNTTNTKTTKTRGVLVDSANKMQILGLLRYDTERKQGWEKL